MNIFDLFKVALGIESSDGTLKALPASSNCGQRCAIAIWAARLFIDASDPAVHAQIRSACFTTVEIYWRG